MKVCMLERQNQSVEDSGEFSRHVHIECLKHQVEICDIQLLDRELCWIE